MEIHGAYNRVEVNGYRYLAHYKKTTHWNLGKPYILYITFNPYEEIDDSLREVTETKSVWNKYPNYLNGFKGGHQFKKYDPTPSPHITRFPLARFPLTQILAYVCASGGIPR